MKSILLSYLLLTAMASIHAQMTLPLYTGTIPNNKPGAASVQEVVNTWTAQDGKTVRFIRKISMPEIYIYLPAKKINSGKAVVILPGGGYSGLAIDHEGHDVAKYFQSQGIAGIVVKNRCPDEEIVINKSIVPLQDAQRAIQLVRLHAKSWGIKINQVGIMGSSAGGHLASTAGTHYETSRVEPIRGISIRPDFMILNYPVISFADSVSHHGSRDNLLKQEGRVDEAQVKLYSNELHVNAQTPPVFITHATDDEVVPIANTNLFVAACQQHGVPVEVFIYARGGHGYGMNNVTAKKQWVERVVEWMK